MRRVNRISFNGSEMRKEWVDEPQIGGFSALLFKNAKVDIEVIGQLPIYKEYKTSIDRTVGFGWVYLKSQLAPECLELVHDSVMDWSLLKFEYSYCPASQRHSLNSIRASASPVVCIR